MTAITRARFLVSKMRAIFFSREVEENYFQKVIIEAFRKVFYILHAVGV